MFIYKSTSTKISEFISSIHSYDQHIAFIILLAEKAE